MKHQNLEGQRFGLLEVLAHLGLIGKYHQYVVGCDCGVIKKVYAHNITKKKMLHSCGCLRNSVFGKQNLKHGKANSREYHIWEGMIQRATNSNHKSYKYYGARNIKVCERWHDFENFYADMGPRPSSKHTLERRDNDGDYCLDNCYWATRAEQSRNRRSNVWIVWKNEKRIMKDWSKIFNVPY
jgi:hypothetical protein